MNFTLALLSL